MRRIGKAKTLLRDAAPCDPKHGWKKGAGKCVRSAKQEGGTSNRGKVAIAAGILGSIAAGGVGIAAMSGRTTKPTPNAETKPDPKVETKPAPKAETKPDPKAEAKPDPKVETKPASKVETKPASKAETKPASKVETKPASKAKTKPAPKAETKPDPKAEAKPDPKAEAKPDPKVETKPASKAETKPAPKVETKPAPKVETKPTPKAETKPDPKVETKPTPKVETAKKKTSDALIQELGFPTERINYLSLQEKEQLVSEMTGFSQEKAKSVTHCVISFTGDSTSVRRKERNDEPMFLPDPANLDKNLDHVKEINDFLGAAPKYQGQISRGFSIPKDDFESFKKATEEGVASSAMSSYSSSFSVALGFSRKDLYGTETVRVIYHVRDNKSGVNIQDISHLPREREVVQPKGTVMRSTSMEVIDDNGDDVYVFYMEEIQEKDKQSNDKKRKADSKEENNQKEKDRSFRFVERKWREFIKPITVKGSKKEYKKGSSGKAKAQSRIDRAKSLLVNSAVL